MDVSAAVTCGCSACMSLAMVMGLGVVLGGGDSSGHRPRVF